ncbi:acyl-CoA dehydrogenase [Rhodobacter sphaeroides]|jgi:Acyl-CoA dehydrogenases|uniref:3-methylmercaptopropionyl-CoA dehydrogenase n=1 Tax=Cereibacter sphaeroides (strain ATCC 17023 / DSM 158 / JCM 6121 / CCUG 31486 / LMG 2827 / NBRC 12203 / NCIMB 8253 / ATH 2.4.1.) TaxID=272943 RepID=Q3IZW4_CERS4|nr:acyl-CoA dehydrogenase [Cereibacter sphaeroides]ABA79920.1 putative acyl-CoA dehydrogenase [Cereibacter sphaeroides 2.4.1]AMJ48189.1 acyl-CoA dehydrogenase [Cereibacter sphaeroides]ANS34899.1 acyl-CoA dehydrogenase [Cereibacter sphaeroides]ATN63949.1 acyl-CoA dehydrogenase [Cereibacter sphaeroides]AXC62124.1 acyl-CoA dehydrogenase [Cereibacter sphaeroides 2.4.1]
MPYRAPLADFRFLLGHVVGLDQVAATERFAEATPETVEAILAEAGKLCEEVLAPLQRPGDLHPARLENGVVRTSPGYAEGYRAIADGGWVGIAASPEHGGMGLPMAVTTAVNEMMSSACLSLQLNPLLTQGQIEALEHHASDALKALYLPKLISGEWSGTMNLTEPQAGSDVGAVRTRAEPLEDGTYAITGQKIYITWADTDFNANVCHLVLARLPDGPQGTRGISLFLVPKFLPDAEGRPGPRNAVTVVSLEEKLGLHGSPTAVMDYDGAKGWLVGAPHKGMAAMFTMMNNARLGVGVQGVGVAEAATQAAVAYAMERRQGGPGGIIEHADVRRMLAVMKAETFSARAIALACAVALDMGRATGQPEWQARAALLTPIAKAYGTDVGIEVASMGVQVHGGTGFIEGTGAAQFLRDVRVTAIYEGTNGIQAMDLVGRKMMDGGEAAFRLLQEIEDAAETARHRLPDLANDVWAASEALREATETLVGQEMQDRFAGAVPYLRAFARVLGAHFHLTAAVTDPAREPLARVAIRRLLPEHAALLAQVREGAAGLYALSPEDLAA